MFNQAFHTKIELILASVHDAETVSLAALGRCLTGLKQCLAEAEIGSATLSAFTDTILDRYAAQPGLPGPRIAAELRHLLGELPGLGDHPGKPAWHDTAPRRAAADCAGPRWDMKELDNRLAGSNRASLSRLRQAMGLISERRVAGVLDLRRGRRFEAGGGMKMGDRHVAGMDGEQVNRLIQCLGRDGDGPNGGRPAVLG